MRATGIVDFPLAPVASTARRSLGSLLVAYSIAFPLFGRAVFPIARDKSGITLLSSFTDPQMAATYLLGLILIARMATGGQVLRGPNFQTIRFLALFVLVALCSAAGSRIPLFSIWRCFEVSLLALWAATLVQDASTGADPARPVRTFYAISVAILAAVLVGLVINPSGAWSMEGDVARLTGTTGYSINPNDIGAIAAVIAVGAYVRAVEFRRPRHVAGALFFTAICYVSHSRASYIAFAGGLLCANAMLGRVPQRRSALWSWTLAACFSIAVLLVAIPAFRNFVVFLMTRGHEANNLESFGGRLQLWEFGLRVFKQHPLLGTGYGTYPQGLEGGHFHNVLMELLVTTGLAGVTCYFIFLVYLAAFVKRAVARSGAGQPAQRTLGSDVVTIPTIILLANGATAGAAYYSWDLLGLVSVAAATAAIARTPAAGPPHAEEGRIARPSNLMQ